MRYKKFQNAGVEVSQLAAGTWSMGGDNYGEVDRDLAVQAIRTMLEGGVNLVDTAPCYGNGTAEKFVGEALQGLRDRVLIATKFGLVPNIFTHGYRRDASYGNIIREIESSLMNLKTDHVDFYFIHWPDAAIPIAETMQALERLREQGYIRFIGVSNFSREQIEEAQRYGRVDVQQPPYSMVNRAFEELMRWGMTQGIDTLTYGSLGSGILSGRYRTMPQFDPNDTRVTFYDFFREPKFSKIQELLRAMDKVAEAHSRPVAQVAINWSVQKEFVGTSLVGVLTPDQAKENCAAFDWSLTPEEVAELDRELDRLQIG